MEFPLKEPVKRGWPRRVDKVLAGYVKAKLPEREEFEKSVEPCANAKPAVSAVSSTSTNLSIPELTT